MVIGPGKSWKSVNLSNKVLLKDVEEQPDEKIEQLENTLICIMGPGKKFLRPEKSPGNLFLKKGTNPDFAQGNVFFFNLV